MNQNYYMGIKKSPDDTTRLVETIVDGAKKKKGEEIISLNFNNIENSICKYFIICHADSNIQVNAIADSIEKKVKEDLNERVWQKGGYENSFWIILDFVDVVVHIFQKEYRDFYKLEDLWADTIKIKYDQAG
ncbi:ribosome silencing factor [Bacteroidota bacterium]